MSKAFSIFLRCLAYVSIAVSLVAMLFSPPAAAIGMLLAIALILLSLSARK